MQQTHKRQWKAPQGAKESNKLGLPADDYALPSNGFEGGVQNQQRFTGGFAGSKAPEEIIKEAPREESKRSGSTSQDPPAPAGAKSSLFGGAKKNVFNPFAKMSGPAKSNASQGSGDAGAGGFGGNTSGFGGANQSRSGFGAQDNAADRSKLSSGNDTSNFDSRIKPVSLNDTGPLNMSNQRKNTSGNAGFGFNSGNGVGLAAAK